MYCRHAILIALFCGLSVSARAQSTMWQQCDHNWAISYGSNYYGLKQHTWVGVEMETPPNPTSTTIYFGSRTVTFNTRAWQIVAIFFAVLLPVVWLIIYGIGSVTKPAKKHPPPNPSPPL
jgi:hypothetical protein